MCFADAEGRPALAVFDVTKVAPRDPPGHARVSDEPENVRGVDRSGTLIWLCTRASDKINGPGRQRRRASRTLRAKGIEMVYLDAPVAAASSRRAGAAATSVVDGEPPGARGRGRLRRGRGKRAAGRRLLGAARGVGRGVEHAGGGGITLLNDVPAL